MRAWIGTSGYAYAEWKGKFYPRDLPASRMFAHYSERFATVEINNTFYRMPTPELCAKWRAAAPAGFRYAVKAPATITHVKRLRGIRAECARFAKALAALGDRRGPVLWQLPPTLKRDVALLEGALAAWPKALPLAVEFRHDSWFDDGVYAALRARQAALCVADTDELATPLIATADWGYLRLRRLDYTPRTLGEWARRIAAQEWYDAWLFTKHEEQALGPAFALRLARQLRAKQ